MEVGVFSKCIRDLILDNDSVEVPGLGVFFAELQPASFSDHRTTINPPYRKMYFRKCDVSAKDAKLLYDYICDDMKVSHDQAEVELKWCLSRLRSELDGNKICALPGLGSMRATSQSDYFFVSDDDLDIFPDGFGLEPVCIKMAKGDTAEQKAAAKAKAKAANQTEEKPMPKAVRIILWVLAAVAIIVGAILFAFPDGFAGFGDFANSMLDKILYTKEDLQLLGR